MPKIVSDQEFIRIEAAVAGHPEGAGLDALYEALQHTPSRRTLQRRLAEMVADRRLSVASVGRALRYKLPDPVDPAIASAEPYVPTSAAGEEIRLAVRRPLHQRRPVGYDVGLLEAYEPNQTFHLPAGLREQLATLGASAVGQVAPAGTFAREILHRLLIDLSWASSRLEGNTYSRLDTERLIDFGQAAEGKDALETQMILNHKAAIEYLVGDPSVALDTETVVAIHALLSDGLLQDPRAGGRVRQRAVEISASVYRPIAMRDRLEELFGIVMRMASDIEDPFESAFFLMVHLPYLQPFEDVNKRVSRVAANIPLMQRNLSPLSFIDVPVQAYVDGMLGVYELGRVELLRDVFVWAYERSCQQYVAVHQQLVPPDTFRLRYRAELGRAVKAIVQRDLSLASADIAGVTPSGVPAHDRERFEQLVRDEFEHLHERNVIRFGLRPLELAQWKQAHGPA